jgi:hypothetical protein
MIDVADLAALAEIYDRYANAIERLAPADLKHVVRFYDRLETRYHRENPTVPYDAFRFEMVKRCKAYLKKNLMRYAAGLRGTCPLRPTFCSYVPSFIASFGLLLRSSFSI